jgi:hypothetical protein
LKSILHENRREGDYLILQMWEKGQDKVLRLNIFLELLGSTQ